MRTHKHLTPQNISIKLLSQRKVVLAGLTGAITLKAFDLDDKTLTTRTSSIYTESQQFHQNMTTISFRDGRVI